MTRKDLINRVAEKFELKKKEAEAIVKFIFQELTEAMKKGERISIQNFGTFTVVLANERRVKIPQGDYVVLPRRKKILFHPSKLVLKELVQNQEEIGGVL